MQVDTGYTQKTSSTELTRIDNSLINSTVSETLATCVISEVTLIKIKIKPVAFTEPIMEGGRMLATPG